ncbi:DUF4329 domain-containing protein [Escherichia coli]|nr:DUF4329 domain-containing protein [Escherichia coli]
MFSSSDKNLVRSKDNNLEAFYLATPDGRFEALNNKGEYIFIRNSVPGLSSVCIPGNDSNLLIVFYVQIMPDDFVMQLHRF